MALDYRLQMSSSLKSATKSEYTGGYGVGIATLICYLILLFNDVVSLAWIALWITHWVQVAEAVEL